MDLRQIKVNLGDFGMMSYDPAFKNTVSCTSRITFIDGEKGILRYRGYDIEELAEKGSFLQICQLLIHGEWPSQAETDELKTQIRSHTMIHEDFKRFFGAMPKRAHPMPSLAAAVGAAVKPCFRPVAFEITAPSIPCSRFHGFC